MSVRRLLGTAVAMAAAGVVLGALSPDVAALGNAVRQPQALADAAGPDAVVLAWAALLAWLTWCWGVLGLLLTAATALPGLAGAAARFLLRGLLPAGARRAAALALGIGLGVGAGAGAPALAAPVPATAVAAPAVSAVPDWPTASAAPSAPRAPAAPEAPPRAAPTTPPAAPPTAPPTAPHTRAAPVPADPAPDWPAPAPGDHVVVRGDCLWDIAAAHLQRTTGREATDREVVAAVHAWWTANAAVIGPDPDLLLPGQVLHPPPAA